MKKNNLEMELKFFLSISARVFKQIVVNKLKAKNVQLRTLETTSMYDNAEEFMLKSDGRLRIRTGYGALFSYKHPITRRGIKIETEYESKIDDPIQLELILIELGYKKVSSYQRFRTIWKTRDTKIFLDEFSFGNYVEIEGKRKDIISIGKKLGFNMKNNITKSYDGIYKEICEQKKIIPNKHIK